MNIIFIGSFCPLHITGLLKNSAVLLYNHSELLIKGFKSHPDINLSVITSPDVISYPKGPLYIKSHLDEESIYLVSSLNIKWINLIWTALGMYKQAKKRIKSSKEPIAVIIPYMVLRHVLVTRFLKFRFKKKIIICTIIPDIFFPSKQRSPMKYWLKKITENMARKSDCFVLYTKLMAEYLKIQNKAHIVMEGIIDSDTNNSNISKDNKCKTEKKIVTYAGSLNTKYGIVRLLDSMKLINNPDIELHLIGKGDAEEIIKDYCKKDTRIKFLGLYLKEDALNEQLKSAILINPRSPEDGEFTKYSFPSKNIEYLLTGNITILCKLPGMPEEYFSYFINAGDCSPNSLANAINFGLNMTEKERIAFGEKAQRFVLDKKNCYYQAERILRLLVKTKVAYI